MGELGQPADSDPTVPQPYEPVPSFQEQLSSLYPTFFTEPEGVITSLAETPESIQAFTFETAKEKLDALPYVVNTEFTGRLDPHQTYVNDEEGFQIPVSRIIAANGFDIDRQPSWAGRGGGYAGASSNRSLDNIIEYAKVGKYKHEDGRLEERIETRVVYGPNGEPFFVLNNGGNHRGAAAKLRGDKTLTIKTIRVPLNPETSTLDRWQVEPLYGEKLDQYVPKPPAQKLGMLTVEEWRKENGIVEPEVTIDKKPPKTELAIVEPEKRPVAKPKRRFLAKLRRKRE